MRNRHYFDTRHHRSEAQRVCIRCAAHHSRGRRRRSRNSHATQTIAPVFACAATWTTQHWAQSFAHTVSETPLSFLCTHISRELDLKPQAGVRWRVISGHTHQASNTTRSCRNPRPEPGASAGWATPIKLPVTLALLENCQKSRGYAKIVPTFAPER